MHAVSIRKLVYQISLLLYRGRGLLWNQLLRRSFEKTTKQQQNNLLVVKMLVWAAGWALTWRCWRSSSWTFWDRLYTWKHTTNQDQDLSPLVTSNHHTETEQVALWSINTEKSDFTFKFCSMFHALCSTTVTISLRINELTDTIQRCWSEMNSWPGQSWSWCSGRTAWHSLWWSTGCQKPPVCQLVELQPARTTHLHVLPTESEIILCN